MPFWDKKPDSSAALASAVSPDVLRQLRTIADKNLAVHYLLLDDDRIVLEVGKCRVQEVVAETSELVLDLPTRDGQPLPVARGQPARLLFDLNSVRLQFDTTVVARALHHTASGQSFQAVLLRPPAKIESGNRRRSFRVEPPHRQRPTVQWRPWIDDRTQRDTFPFITAAIRDISCLGIGILADPKLAARLPSNCRIELTILLPGRPAPLRLFGRVCRQEPPTEKVPKTLLGVEFEIDSKEGADGFAGPDELTHYVADCQREIAKALRG